MKDLILDSVRCFADGNLLNSASALNQHFVETVGREIVVMGKVDVHKLADSLDWHLFVDRLLVAAWSGDISIGKIYRAIWESYPSRFFPSHVASFNCWVFEGGLDYSDEEAYSVFGLAELVSTISEGIRDGSIQFCPNGVGCGFLPSIDEDFFEILSNSQRNTYFASQLTKESLGAIALRSDNYQIDLSERYARFLAKYSLIACVSTPLNLQYLPTRLVSIHVKYPEFKGLISKAIQTCAASIPSDDELADFVYLNTCGQVLPEYPREWMMLLSESFASGILLIPSNLQ